MQVTDASAPLRREPAPDAPLETEALFGEGGHGLRRERRLGLGPARARRLRRLYAVHRARARRRAATHRVAALRTHVYPGPSIKLPPRMALSLGARAHDRPARGRFRRDRRRLLPLGALPRGGRIRASPTSSRSPKRFLHAPYLWGGRTSEGIDCSGLVQAALTAAGVAAPRDSDHAGGLARRAGS